MITSMFNHIEYLYILGTWEPIQVNDDINFQFDARAMTSLKFWEIIIFCGISDSSLL